MFVTNRNLFYFVSLNNKSKKFLYSKSVFIQINFKNINIFKKKTVSLRTDSIYRIVNLSITPSPTKVTCSKLVKLFFMNKVALVSPKFIG